MARKQASKRYHHGDLREALVAAGTDIVETEGLDAFTLRECARRAGVSHAAPRNHFESVDDLISEIAARGFESFHHQMGLAAHAAGDSPDKRLEAMGRAYVAFARSCPGVYALMFRTGRPLKRTARLGEAAEAAWRQLVQAVIAVIGPARRDAELRAAHVWSLVHGMASLIVDHKLRPQLSVDQMVATAVMNVSGYIRSGGDLSQTPTGDQSL